MRRYFFAATLIALLWAPGAHASDRGPLRELPNASVGSVRGTQAFVGLSVAGGRVRAYVCDGTLRRDPTVSQWFSGRWDGRGAVVLRAGGHVLRLAAGGGSFDGHAFSVRP